MNNLSGSTQLLLSLSVLLVLSNATSAQRARTNSDDSEFGPVVTAYLGYLHNEQEVVDDRASRREITPAYYRRNSNRIHALRQMALRLVRRSGNDYVPELEAVTSDELGILFESPPKPASLRLNEVVSDKFRFLGVEHTGEVFYLFARLDPYEQAELLSRRGKADAAVSSGNPNGQRVGQTSTRQRRVVPR